MRRRAGWRRAWTGQAQRVYATPVDPTIAIVNLNENRSPQPRLDDSDAE